MRRRGVSLRSITHTISVRCSDPLNFNISFRQELSSATWKSEIWLERLKENNLFSWVDNHGNTPLTAIVKKWKDGDKELQLGDIVSQLIKSGVEVNMRDRNGNTALAIATLPGSRPCVVELLSEEHCRIVGITVVSLLPQQQGCNKRKWNKK